MVQASDTVQVDYELSDDGWAKAKRLDGHPNREWSYPVFGSRATALDRSQTPLANFYEPLEDLEQVLRIEHINLDLTNAGMSLNARQQVGVGLSWRRSWFQVPDGVIPPPRDDDELVGRHYVWLYGLRGTDERLMFLNRWPGWGQSGYGVGYLRKELFNEYVEDIWLNRSSHHGPSPAQARETQGVADLKALRQAWVRRREHIATGQLIANRLYQLHSALVTSARAQENVRLLEVRNTHIGLARLHLRFGRDKETAWLDELFVRPTHRRQQIGSWLLNRAIRVARNEKYREMRLRFYEGDALAVTAAGTMRFFAQHEFSWRREEGPRPNYNSIASKTL